jgi:hypothetical protein
VPAQDRIGGDQEPQPLAPRFRYHAEQGREHGPVRQFRVGRRSCRRCCTASRWRRIKISAVFHTASRWDSRSHEVTCVIKRKTNRRHMIGDHHGRTPGGATLLVRAVDACGSDPASVLALAAPESTRAGLPGGRVVAARWELGGTVL